MKKKYFNPSLELINIVPTYDGPYTVLHNSGKIITLLNFFYPQNR